MLSTELKRIFYVAPLVSVFLVGCSTFEGIKQDFKTAFSKEDAEGQKTSESGSEGSVKAAEPPVAEKKGPPPGMDANGNVINPKIVEAGNGKKVTGIDGWEGEITGKPVRGSKFAKLKIGMPLKQVTDIAGEPTDKGAHVTGKAFIPFFFGSDAYRYELVYKGHGRLLFAGGSVGNVGGGNLIWIIHSAKEAGYR